MGAQSVTSPRRVAATLKEEQCIQLRAAGLTFKQIAEATGYANSSAAYKATLRAIARHQSQPEAVAHLRVISAIRYDDLYRRASEVLVRPHYVVSGGKVVQHTQPNPDGSTSTRPLIDDSMTMRVIETMLHIEERRAAMFGLDAAQKYDITATVDIAVDIREAVRAKAEQLRSRQAGMPLIPIGGPETRN